MKMKIALIALTMLSLLLLAVPLLHFNLTSSQFVIQPSISQPADQSPVISSDSDNVERCKKSSSVEVERSVPLIEQNPELPNGCEVTSLAMLLAWAGTPVDKVELSENYLPKEDISSVGPDPELVFAGDPADADGWYCFEDPILMAGNTYLSEQSSRYQAISLTGISQAALERYLDADIPLAVWVTLDYSEPVRSSAPGWALADGSWYIPYGNLHCVVLTGWDGEDYQIADPLSGWESVAPDRFWQSFDAMGQRAVALLNGKTARCLDVEVAGDSELTF